MIPAVLEMLMIDPWPLRWGREYFRLQNSPSMLGMVILCQSSGGHVNHVAVGLHRQVPVGGAGDEVRWRGVVDHDVQPAQLLDSFSHRRFHAGLVGQVEADIHGGAAGGLDLADHPRAGVRGAAGDRHSGAFGGELLRDRFAEPTRAAGNQCALAVQPAHVRPFVSFSVVAMLAAVSWS
jgi:hypothetical protein